MKGAVIGYQHISGSKSFIPKEDEIQLSELVKDLSKNGFPMRKPEIQVLTAQFAEANGIKGLAPGKAGHNWFQGFLRRNPGLSMRKLEALSSARAACFNLVSVQR